MRLLDIAFLVGLLAIMISLFLLPLYAILVIAFSTILIPTALPNYLGRREEKTLIKRMEDYNQSVANQEKKEARK